jgi:hypothetical protein
VPAAVEGVQASGLEAATGAHDVQQTCRTLHGDADLERPYLHTEGIRQYVAQDTRYTASASALN